MVYEKSTKVFSCCGQYIVPTKATANSTIICPRCGQKQIKPIECPHVLIVKK